MMLLAVGVVQAILGISYKSFLNNCFMNNCITHLKSVLLLLSFVTTITTNAQSYVTYNHDAAKMNQITVQEIGAGCLTPDLYYWAFHHSYQKSAASKNKLTYRALAGIAAFPQVDDADSVKTALEKRAEIEALNIADRQIDLAWLAEGSKITGKLNDFQTNINRIVGAGGTFQDKERWNDYYHIFECAIKATQDAYMPNAQRKKEYLAIYSDISKQNEILIANLVQLNKKSKTADLLSATYNKPDHRGAIATAAYNRWRDAGWKSKNSSDNDSNNGSTGSGIIIQE